MAVITIDVGDGNDDFLRMVFGGTVIIHDFYDNKEIKGTVVTISENDN